jgi:hypothetical protein
MRSRDITICVTRVAAGVAGSSLILAASTAIAQQHHHPPHDQAIHERFYSTWMMPDNRIMPCCDNQDCSPAESRVEDGNWVARKVGGDGDWIAVPPEKIEHDRQSPDGRSHLCSRRYRDFEARHRGSRVLLYSWGRLLIGALSARLLGEERTSNIRRLLSALRTARRQLGIEVLPTLFSHADGVIE